MTVDNIVVKGDKLCREYHGLQFIDDFRKQNRRRPDAFISLNMKLLPENKNKKYSAVADPLLRKAS